MQKRNVRRPLLAFCLALILLVQALPLGAGAASSSQLKEELSALRNKNKELQAQIDTIQTEYDANTSEIEALVTKKNAIDQQIALLHEQIITMNEEIRVCGQLIADSQDELDEANVHLTQLNEKHKDRIRAMEEQGTLTYWQVIFMASSFTDLLDRISMVDEIAAADQRRLGEIRSAADQVAQVQNQLQQEREELSDAQDQLADTQTELDGKRAESDAVLRELIQKGEEFQELLDKASVEKNALLKQIAQKEREVQAAQYQEELVKLAQQGKNPPSNSSWLTPVSGYTISSPFGNRTSPTAGASSYHQGVDMACPGGTPIYASRGGVVSIATYSASAGYYVSISHGDGFGSVYMHMTNYIVSSGQSVSQGQCIGYVGSTGVSTGNHLHFGVTYGGAYVNPMAYIG